MPRLPNSFSPHPCGSLRPTPWGSAPNPALAVRQGLGILHPSPAPASSVFGLQGVKRLSRHKRERKKPLSHLFHGPLDPLSAITSHPLPNEPKTMKRSIQGGVCASPRPSRAPGQSRLPASVMCCRRDFTNSCSTRVQPLPLSPTPPPQGGRAYRYLPTLSFAPCHTWLAAVHHVLMVSSCENLLTADLPAANG